MAEHGALATLKDLAEKEVEDAARLLGEMRRGCQQAEEQLKMLIDYQNEYRNNLNSDMSAGITSNRWINYQQFIQTLEKAITQHRQQLNQWTQKVDIALNSWREKKTTFAGLADTAGTAIHGGTACRKPPRSEKDG
ncbi:flagellar protein FliJ [Escherichia coli]|nr:flagellar protein FliJ [Escherichia coli]